MLRPVAFVPGSSPDTSSSFFHPGYHGNSLHSTEDEGVQIRKFYEDTISNVSTSSSQRDTSPKRILTSNNDVQRSPTLKPKLSLAEFLKCAAENDVSIISKYVAAGFDLDAEDLFGWTALMCAAQRGSFETIRLLALSGADYRKANRKNQTAKDLALITGVTMSSTHANVIAYLTELEKYTSFDAMEAELSNEPDGSQESQPSKPFFCPTCGVTFHETTTADHQTSILHQLNTGSQPTRTLYGLSEFNIGFRMLKKAGWDSEKGLGVDQTGRKFPLATVFKRNRHGLGHGQSMKETPRVTHYPHLLEAGKKDRKPDVCITRQEMNTKEMAARQQNMRLRRELNGL
ncbi:hypothetical protein RvY_18688 [Ramazzottius varieornatus]|uniref:G-patch domain-containing protein n=1 Tax=Ramazzottius varieornatus TaxID=947166 RepID=A0A1D1W6S6_RAMVA|nr:hypothetical protein RvY_18688 [Ramazzottius varieornatus]